MVTWVKLGFCSKNRGPPKSWEWIRSSQSSSSFASPISATLNHATHSCFCLATFSQIHSGSLNISVHFLLWPTIDVSLLNQCPAAPLTAQQPMGSIVKAKERPSWKPCHSWNPSSLLCLLKFWRFHPSLYPVATSAPFLNAPPVPPEFCTYVLRQPLPFDLLFSLTLPFIDWYMFF